MQGQLKIVNENAAKPESDWQRIGWFGVLLQRMMARGEKRKVKRMHLVETLPLGNRRELILVECWGRKYMVGCGPDAVGTITAVGALDAATPVKPANSAEWV